MIARSLRTLPSLRGGCQGRGVVVSCTRRRCTRLWHRTCKTSRSNKKASLRRLAAYRGTSLRSWFQKKCLLRLKHTMAVSLRRFAAYRGTSLRSWFQKKSFATPLRGLSVHFASLVVSKKVPPTYWDFDFFFSKIPTILKLKVRFFST